MTVSAPRLRAGSELRRTRERLGLSGTAVGQALGWSQSKVSRIETGRFGATVWELAELADYYGLQEEVRAEILSCAAEDSGLPGAWLVRAGGPPRRRQEVATIESRTARVRQYQNAVIPGLLQAPGYTREMVRLSGFGDPDEVAQHRQARQAELFGDGGPQYDVVLDESLLIRTNLSRGVMHEQLVHLLSVGSAANVDVRLIANAAPDVTVMNGFVMYDFLAPESPDVVLVETQTADVYLSADADVHAYGNAFESLRASALGSRATTTRLRRLLGGRH